MEQEFLDIIDPIIKNEEVQKMNNFKHHKNCTCLEHSLHVAEKCYQICKKRNLDYVSATRAGLLHDLFLYNWHEESGIKKHYLHGFFHPKASLINATKIINLNKIEKDMIIKHMWPLTIKLPRYKETYVICWVDKVCCVKEVLYGKI